MAVMRIDNNNIVFTRDDGTPFRYVTNTPNEQTASKFQRYIEL
nr:hypothetical protein [Neobacillus sp. Marseille-Q6967]